MKKILSTLLIATLGGVIAIKIQQRFLPPSATYSPSPAIQNISSSRLVNFTGSTPTFSDFTRAAESSLNAVVHIKTSVSETYNGLVFDPFHQYFYGKPQERIQQGSGSGVIIDKHGYIVTNNHVIDRAEKIEVILNDKRSYPAELIGTDPQTDLALLKIKEENLPFLPYGNSDLVKVGEWCLAVGNPFNLTSTVTAGIISAKGRNINILESDPTHGIYPIESFIQTDAAVNPGNSGGALVSTDGNLIGINSAIASQNGAYIGYSFAIPVNIVKKVVADLSEFGTVQRAFIGVGIHDIDASFAAQNNLSHLKGAYVSGLSEKGSAEQAGIQIGDIITMVEDQDVDNVSELQEQIGKYRPGDKVNVTAFRGEKEMKLSLLLTNKEGTTGLLKKEKPVEKPTMLTLGAAIETVTKEEMQKLHISNGVKISKLHNGKIAMAGIREGFIIITIDKKKVNTPEEVENCLAHKQGGVLIEGIYPNGMRAYYGFGL